MQEWPSSEHPERLQEATKPGPYFLWNWPWLQQTHIPHGAENFHHTGPSGTGTCWCRVSRGTFHLLCCSPLHSSSVTVPITVLPWPWRLMTLAQWTLGMRTHSSFVGPWLAIPFNAVEYHVVSIVNKKNNSCCSQKHWQLSQLPDPSGCPPGTQQNRLHPIHEWEPRRPWRHSWKTLGNNVGSAIHHS